MNDNKSSLSQYRSYQEIGEYWDKHELGEALEESVEDLALTRAIQAEEQSHSINRDEVLGILKN